MKVYFIYGFVSGQASVDFWCRLDDDDDDFFLLLFPG